jgi:hypothetical protein
MSGFPQNTGIATEIEYLYNAFADMVSFHQFPAPLSEKENTTSTGCSLSLPRGGKAVVEQRQEGISNMKWSFFNRLSYTRILSVVQVRTPPFELSPLSILDYFLNIVVYCLRLVAVI